MLHYINRYMLHKQAIIEYVCTMWNWILWEEGRPERYTAGLLATITAKAYWALGLAGHCVLRLPAHLVPQPVLPVNVRGKLHTQARMQRAGCGPHILYLFSGNAAGRSQTTLWVSNLGATPWGGHQYRRTFPGGGNWGAETLNDQQEWRNEGLNQVSMTPVQQQHSSARSVFLFVLFFCHTAWLAGF